MVNEYVKLGPRRFQCICQVCGCKFIRDRYPRESRPHKYCSTTCMGKAQKEWVGKKSPLWKGGKGISKQYVTVYTPGHPKASESNHVTEHRIVVEKAMGKYLPDNAVVHHVNGNKQDNRPRNLVVCQDNAYHKLIHARERRLKSTGSFDLKKCACCQQIFTLEEFGKDKSQWDNKRLYCNSCEREKLRESRAFRKSEALTTQRCHSKRVHGKG